MESSADTTSVISRRKATSTPTSDELLPVTAKAPADNDDDGLLHSFDGVILQHHHGAYVGPQASSTAPHHQESHMRSIVKGITWRVLATTTTTIREVGSALQIGLMEFVAKLGLYYLHERAWVNIRL